MHNTYFVCVPCEKPFCLTQEGIPPLMEGKPLENIPCPNCQSKETVEISELDYSKSDSEFSDMMRITKLVCRMLRTINNTLESSDVSHEIHTVTLPELIVKLVNEFRMITELDLYNKVNSYFDKKYSIGVSDHLFKGVVFSLIQNKEICALEYDCFEGIDTSKLEGVSEIMSIGIVCDQHANTIRSGLRNRIFFKIGTEYISHNLKVSPNLEMLKCQTE